MRDTTRQLVAIPLTVLASVATACAPSVDVPAATPTAAAPTSAAASTSTPAATAAEALSPTALDALVNKHFLAINEVDPSRLRERMGEAYAEDIAFQDPGADSHGRAAVAETLERLHARYPGAVFHREGALQDRNGTIRVGWSLAVPGAAPLHRGEDIMRIEGGRIRSIWVFIEPSSSATSAAFAGIDHTGITVPDLSAATTFFRDVMGCEPMTSMGAFKTNDDWLKVHLGVDARAEIVGIAMLRCGVGSNVELLQYRDGTRHERAIGNTDINAAHLAFYTSDMKAAVAHLARHGITTMGEPTAKTSGDTGGETFVYFRSPWGLQFELVSFPEGKAYEKNRSGRILWSPLRPAE